MRSERISDFGFLRRRRDLPAFARLNDAVGQERPGRVFEGMEAKVKVKIKG